MIRDVRNAFCYNFDRDSLTCELPGIFDDIKLDEKSFEVVFSGNMQTLHLDYRHNVVSKTCAFIFETTAINRADLEPLVYSDSKARA